jgi:beta-glucosidase
LLRRHGLSYTTFKYSDLKVSEPTAEDNDISVVAKFTVRNTGNMPGSEIAQLYISWPSTSTLTHPLLTLKGFSKVFLEAGESRTVELHLDKYAVSSWHEGLKQWVVEKGSYTVSVGPSSQVLPLTATMKVGTGFEWAGL